MKSGILTSNFSLVTFALHVLLFFAAIALYTLTLNGDVQPADSGEFQIAAITLGIPHPPGYPLFTMLGWLFAQVPIGSPYARVSFLSVVASAAALVLVSLTVQQVVQMGRGAGEQENRTSAHPHLFTSSLSGLLAAIALGTSTTFWAQATTTNIRSLTAFFTALMLYASVRAYATRRASSLILFALAFGLGVGHHVSLVFVGVVLGAYVVYTTWRAWRDARDESERLAFPHAAIYSLVVLVATQLVWLYLPIRDAAGARFAPGNLNTFDGLLFHIFARGFAGDMLAFAAPEFLFDRFALLPTLLQFQFSLPVLIGIAIGWVVLLWRRAALGIVWFIAFALHLFITLTYRAPQTVEYAMPCWVIASVVLGVGLGTSVDVRRKTEDTRQSSIFRLSSLVLLFAAFTFTLRDVAVHWPSFVYLSNDRSTRTNAQAVLRTALQKSSVLSQWHQATPMWALQDIEGLRRDVEVQYVYPRGAQRYAVTFAEQAAQRSQQDNVHVTSLFASEYAAQGLHAYPEPYAPAWRIEAGAASPGNPTQVIVFDERLEIVSPIGLDSAVVETGQAVDADVRWRATGSASVGDSFTVRIIRPDGRLAANADLRLTEADANGNWRARRLRLGISLDVPPGEYDVLVGVYRASDKGFVQYTDEQGNEFVPVAKITVVPASLPPATQYPANATRSVMAEPQLVGVDYDTGTPGQLRVWTHWQLGQTAQEITLVGANNQPLAPPKQLSATTVVTQPQYLSLPFDTVPTRDIRLSTTNQRLPGYADGQRYIPFANQMALIGLGAHRSGASLKVDLNWLAARPITNDYIVSMRIEGNGIYQTHDSVPALGTIPTLKWIRNSQVTDRHPFDLGDYNAALRGSVVVYDSVSQLPLPPLDERYDNGITIPIE